MKIISTATRRALLALPVLVCLALPALAQTPIIQAVTRFRVKPDRVADFRAAVTDHSALLKKANVDESSYWMVAQSGEPLFLLIRRYSGYAGLDRVNNPKLKDVSPYARGRSGRNAISGELCANGGDDGRGGELRRVDAKRGKAIPRDRSDERGRERGDTDRP